MDDLTEIKKEARADKERLVALRREFHRRPEASYKEYRTAERIEQELAKLGIPTRRVTETGVLGVIRGEKEGGHTVALRADIDALPVKEAVQREYSSLEPGVMHACGHDGHITCLLGAASILAAHKADFGGEVRLIFQPAEELGGCANEMIAQGVLGDAQRVFGLHVAPDLPCGTVGLTPGLNNASVDQFIIRVKGRSSHVCAPHMGVDALYIASQIVVAVQAMVTRMSSPIEPLIIGVGKLTAGTTYNALAESAVLEGTTRTVSVESRERVRGQVEATANSIAALYGGTAEVSWKDFASPLINHADVCREAASVADGLFGPGHVVSDRALSMSGDNFAEYMLQIPGAYAYLGTGNPNIPHTREPIHSTSFDMDEDALPIGAALLAGFALSWLTGALE